MPWCIIFPRGPWGTWGRSLGIRRLPMHTASPEKPSINESEALSVACLAILSGGKDFPHIFTSDEELDLANHISMFAQAGFPFTTTEIHALGYEFAEEWGIQGLSAVGKVASRKWFKGFMSRHKGLALKSPKLLSVYWAKCANRDVLNGWFDVYESVLEEKGINTPINIWNIDECGCIDTPKPKQIVCPVKVRPNQHCSSENWETSAVVFVNAAGYHLKPLVIHKGTCVQDSWKQNMLEGTTLGVSENS